MKLTRLLLCTLVLSRCAGSAFAQVTPSDEVLLKKARAIYDQPFLQGLVSFDCQVMFDWKAHFLELLQTIPPSAEPTVSTLQAIQHRVFVDRSGAVVSAVPKEPNLAGVLKGQELEQAFKQMVGGGINAWMPFGTNVILPMGSTKYQFEKLPSGYKLVMNGPGVASTLLLEEDLRLTSGVSTQPQPMRFTTQFISGPHGLLLQSVKTSDTTGSGAEASFSYDYQEVQGVQLPSMVHVKPATSELWEYHLSDCKVVKGIVIEVGLPKSK